MTFNVRDTVLRALLAAVVTSLFCAQNVRADSPAADLRAEYATLAGGYSNSVGNWRPTPPESGTLLFVAPDEYAPAAAGGDDLIASRNAYADALFELAKRAAEAGQMSLAFQWATETLRENPAHADARRVLGYEERDGKWLLPYGVRMADAGNLWHPKFGWINKDDAARYERGERRLGKRWITAEEDAARHREMKQGWQVRTDHFLVTTNHSLEVAAELAARLERLHQIWRQLFAGYFLTENEVRGLFAGERPPRTQLRPFRVYYHRDRDEYTRALRRRQPRIGETQGIYFDDAREAHFFAESDMSDAGTNDDSAALGTLYHEAVHQLFQESKTSAKRVGGLANFWVVEGVATYFETLREHDDPVAGRYFTIGEADAGRLPMAREHVKGGFYIPLAELAAMSQSDVQRHAEIKKLYTQSSGVAAFLMDGQQGQYREALVRYLDAVYRGRDSAQSLPENAGKSFSELDLQYRRHMERLP